MNAVNLDESGAGGPSAEKRRSKLGYHRTSVACVHCRRRKIRCLPAEKDPQGRCLNCIRLKKECTYNPVEHPSAADQRPQPTQRRSGLDEPASSISSSPGPSTPSINGFESMGYPSPAAVPNQGLGHSMGLGHDTASPLPASFSFGNSPRHSTWSPGYAGDTMPGSVGYSMAPARPSAATRAMSVGGPHMAYADHGAGMPWPPTRSASFGGVTDMNHQYPVPDAPQQQFHLPYHFHDQVGAAAGHHGSAVSGMNVMPTPPADQMMSPYAYSPGWIHTSGSADRDGPERHTFGAPWSQ